MDRSEAEAIYDAGRERCVEFILELARGLGRLTAANARLEERVRRLEEQLRKNSSNSSTPPSADLSDSAATIGTIWMIDPLGLQSLSRASGR